MYKRQLEDLAEIEKSVDEFLDLMNAKADEPQAEVDLAAVVLEAVAAFGQHGDGLRLKLEGTAPRSRIRRRAFMYLIRALLDNAWRHGLPPVEIRVFALSGRAVVEIQDSGAGVAANRLERLGRYQPRSRHGFGLMVARRLVESMSGKLLLRNGSPGLIARLELPAGQLADADPVLPAEALA